MTSSRFPAEPFGKAINVSIGRASSADAVHFPSIERSAGTLFEEAPGLAWLATAPDRSASQYRTLIAQGLSWTAVTPEGRRVGFIASTIEESEIHVWELAVSRPFQGRGIGGSLLAKAISEGRHRGFAAITLTTFRDLPWNAPFYGRSGFTILSDGEITPRLRAVLDEERMQGLPLDRRCAMCLRLAGSSETGTG